MHIELSEHPLARAQQLRKKAVKAARARWEKEKNGNASASDTQCQAKRSERNGIEGTISETSRIRKDRSADTVHIADAVGKALPMVSKLKPSSSSSLQSPVSSSSLRFEGSSSPEVSRLHFDDSLRQIIRPRSQSDRTCFRDIGNWLVVNIYAGRFNDEIFQRVLEYAAEAAKGRSRNPAAVFMSILKRQLGYKSD